MRRLITGICGDLSPGLAGLLALVFLAEVSATRQYAAVWRSEPTLWAYAVTRAPEKPRTLNNYGVTLAMQGRFDDARVVFERAHQAGLAPHLPPWDHIEGELRARENLTALSQLVAGLHQ